MTAPSPILVSIGFLHRRPYLKAVRQEMMQYGLRPMDLLTDGPPVFDQTPLAAASDLMSKARGYLTVIDTKHIMMADKSHAERLRLEFDQAVANNLPIGLLVVRGRASAPKYVDKRLQQAAEQFKSFHARHSKDLRSLQILTVDPDNYLSGIRDLLGFLRSKAEPADDPDLVTTPPSIPDQSPAPVRVEERNGRIALVSDRDSALGATEVDFNGWREPVLDHVQEFLSGDFRPGTNHSRARDRLVALTTLLVGTVAAVKERQFRIGYEIERLDGLVSAYRSSGDDMPALNAAALEDLDRLRIALVMGVGKLERWSEFRRSATSDPMQEGSASPGVVSSAINKMAAGMEGLPTYFDPQLPQTLRFLAESTQDPLGATKTVVYGAVKSAENVIVFLGQRALGIWIKAVDAVGQHISKAVATTLIVGLSGGHDKSSSQVSGISEHKGNNIGRRVFSAVSGRIMRLRRDL